MVEAGGVSLLIDVGPDFRMQAMRESITKIDAVFITHHHFDHVAGLDDLRPFLFRNREPIPCFAYPETARILKRMYGYIFEDGSYPGVPNLALHEIDGPFAVTSRDHPTHRITVEPIAVWHADLRVAACRIGRFAYVTDANRIPADGLRRLQDLDVLVLDALRREPHPAPLTIDEAADVADDLQVPRTVLIHMTHSILHAEEEGSLPEGVELGYDGLRLTARL